MMKGKKTIYKTAALLLCCALVVAALGGCTGASGTAENAATDSSAAPTAEQVNAKTYSWALQDEENYYKGLFGKGEVTEVNVEISEEDWADLCANAKDEEYHPASVNYNMSIGGFSGDNGASVSADVTTGLYGVNAETRPLISKLLAVDEYYERYIGYVSDLCACFSDIGNIVKQLSDKISAYVNEDPSAFYTYEQYLSSITGSGKDLSGGAGFAPVGDMPQMPGGDMPQMPDGGMPQMPGGDMPQMPGGDMPQKPDGGMPQMPDGGMPQMPPDGFDPSGAPDEQGFPSGERPHAGGFPGQGGFQQMGEGMMNSVGCSIVDYISQRIETIQSQINS